MSLLPLNLTFDHPAGPCMLLVHRTLCNLQSSNSGSITLFLVLPWYLTYIIIIALILSCNYLLVWVSYSSCLLTDQVNNVSLLVHTILVPCAWNLSSYPQHLAQCWHPLLRGCYLWPGLRGSEYLSVSGVSIGRAGLVHAWLLCVYQISVGLSYVYVSG